MQRVIVISDSEREEEENVPFSKKPVDQNEEADDLLNFDPFKYELHFKKNYIFPPTVNCFHRSGTSSSIDRQLSGSYRFQSSFGQIDSDKEDFSQNSQNFRNSGTLYYCSINLLNLKQLSHIQVAWTDLKQQQLN